MGLFAAIPAVIAYNVLNNQIREFGSRMDDFSLELLNVIERTPQGAPAPRSAVAEAEYRG
jgi:biopolymer transport protein TolQ